MSFTNTQDKHKLIQKSVNLSLERRSIQEQMSLDSKFYKVETFMEPGPVESMVIRLERSILYETTEKQTKKVPSGPWQSFKEHYFPDWLLDRFPVEYDTIDFHYKIMYPELEPTLRNQSFAVATIIHTDEDEETN